MLSLKSPNFVDQLLLVQKLRKGTNKINIIYCQLKHCSSYPLESGRSYQNRHQEYLGIDSNSGSDVTPASARSGSHSTVSLITLIDEFSAL